MSGMVGSDEDGVVSWRDIVALSERVSKLEVSVNNLNQAIQEVERKVDSLHNTIRGLTFTVIGAIIIQILLRVLGM
jgi:type II secretory pathway component PulF